MKKVWSGLRAARACCAVGALVAVALFAEPGSLFAESHKVGKPDPALATASQPIDARLAEPGLESLAAGSFAQAAAQFQVALQAEARSGPLHFLLGVAYHRLSVTEGSSYRPLAETALRVALQIDPSLAVAYAELGRLYLENARFADAEAMFANAAAHGDDSERTRQGLAFAAYAAFDQPVADMVAAKLPDDAAQTWRIRALIAASENKFADADAAGARAAALDPNARRGAMLKASLVTWQTIQNSVPAVDTTAPQTVVAPGQATLPAQLAPPLQPATTATNSEEPLARDWSDCPQRREPFQTNLPAVSAMIAMPGTISTAEESANLSALPSPCRGRPLPRMVVIDAVIIRTIINGSSSQGVNLLDQLAVVFGGSIVRGTTDVMGGPTAGLIKTLTTSASVGLPATGIQYSLNIANANGSRSEVLARPTLLALDRQPSVLFSGSTLTVALTGQLAGGILQQLPVGLNLSATPTFIDDDTLLLAVKASRSFFESTSGGTFGQALQTSRNTVTANAMVRMGQTIVLSGLNERETQDIRSETPVLGKLPVLQYLFKRRLQEDFRTELIILLTPRAMDFDRSEPGHATAEALPESDRQALADFKRRAVSMFHPWPNIDAIRYHIRTNKLIKAVTGGRPEDEMWETAQLRFSLVREFKSVLFF